MSTNVFWAGNVNGAPVVTIFNNSLDEEGNNKPVYNRFDNLDKIYFDSRFNYINLVWQLDLTFAFSNISIGNSGQKITTIGYHNLGYTPAGILIDSDTREIVTNNNYIQIVNFDSSRKVSLLIDSVRFYLKEDYDSSTGNLPALTKRYTILGLNIPAN
jgi:hypothetical protein